MSSVRNVDSMNSFAVWLKFKEDKEPIVILGDSMEVQENGDLEIYDVEHDSLIAVFVAGSWSVATKFIRGSTSNGSGKTAGNSR